MPRFAANLSYLFLDRPFLARFQAAADAGFTAVEFHFPYAEPAEAVAEAARTAGVEVVLFNLPPGDWAAGERGIACLPGREAEFAAGVDQALAYARVLNVPRLNCLAGLAPAGQSQEVLRETLVGNLRFAAARLAEEGRELLLEPINSRDMPGFFINRTAEGLAVLDAVGAPNLRLQYDLYHAQVMEGNLVNTLRAHLGCIGHIQLADNPGRGEPGTGEIRFPFVFAALDELDYPGWVGCEYRPTTPLAEDSLGWLQSWQQRMAT